MLIGYAPLPLRKGRYATIGVVSTSNPARRGTGGYAKATGSQAVVRMSALSFDVLRHGARRRTPERTLFLRHHGMRRCGHWGAGEAPGDVGDKKGHEGEQ